MLATSHPQTFNEATSGMDRDSWMESMTKEILSLVEKDVFDLVPLPKCKCAIGCKWAFKTKLAENTPPERKKVCLVSKGFLQRPGIDYHEIYAPSTQRETGRLLLSRMVQEARESCEMDFMTIF